MKKTIEKRYENLQTEVPLASTHNKEQKSS